MLHINNNINFILAASLLITFTACGGGGGSSSSPSSVVNSISFSGIAVDGYIRNATACLDTNINGVCDNGEPTTETLIDGTFTFSDVEVTDGVLMPVIISGGFDTATGKVFTGKLSNIINTTDIAQNISFSVSPLSDLVAASFLASNDKSDTVLQTIKLNVANSLGLSVEKVDADPMQNKEVFAKAQEIQQIKELMLTSANKGANVIKGSTESKALEISIARAVASAIQVNGRLSPADAIAKFEELESSITIPANEKEFIALQVTEIANSLSDMVADVSVSMDDLDQEQGNLEDIVEVASSNIASATQNSAITVVTENTPLVSIIPTPPAPPVL